MKRAVLFSLLCALALAASGCVGIRNYSSKFVTMPAVGMSELEMIKMYGKPEYSTTMGEDNVYVYRVEDELYVILFGISDTFDLVIICRDGQITESKKVKRGDNVAILQPNTWQVN